MTSRAVVLLAAGLGLAAAVPWGGSTRNGPAREALPSPRQPAESSSRRVAPEAVPRTLPSPPEKATLRVRPNVAAEAMRWRDSRLRRVRPNVAAEAIRWRDSRSLGLPYDGRLVRGVKLPAEGRHFFTWDPVRERSPNRWWRRFGSDRLLRTLLEVLADYATAHPKAPRLGIGDLSRPSGGAFGPCYGWPGHVSHQNGLDVDVYYPRHDRRELPVATPVQIHRQLAQDLVDRFVRAGARHVFIGPNTRLRGPANVVQILARYHDNHMHVRLPADSAVGDSAHR